MIYVYIIYIYKNNFSPGMASFSPLSHCKSKQLQRRVEQLFGWIFIRDHRVVGNLEASLGQEEPGSRELSKFQKHQMRHTNC